MLMWFCQGGENDGSFWDSLDDMSYVAARVCLFCFVYASVFFFALWIIESPTFCVTFFIFFQDVVLDVHTAPFVGGCDVRIWL